MSLPSKSPNPPAVPFTRGRSHYVDDMRVTESAEGTCQGGQYLFSSHPAHRKVYLMVSLDHVRTTVCRCVDSGRVFMLDR